MKLHELVRGLNKFDVLIGYGNKRDWTGVDLPVDSVHQIIDDVETGNSSYLGAAIHAIYRSSGNLRAERFEFDEFDTEKNIVTLHFFGNLDGQEIQGRVKLRVGSLLEI